MPEVTRRELLQGAGAGALALGLGLGLGGRSARAAAEPGGRPYNVLFILTDQERHFRPGELPSSYSLPGRERLAREGTTFANHQIGSAVCSSSRSVIYTGQHIPNSGIFDNMGFPWQASLSPEIPTVGDRMRALGHRSAYVGKWHLSQEMEEIETGEVPDADLSALNALMNEHGFSDYFGVGDIIGTTLGGYEHDAFITSLAIRWLRASGRPLNQAGGSWFLAVNLVNPHDVMYFDTDLPGESGQKATPPLMEITPPPPHSLYNERWGMALPESRHEPWDLPGRPAAHRDYQYAMGQLVGVIPNEDPRWRRLSDFYLSCLADSDRHVARLLQELDELGITNDTIVVLTADHGELAGAHGMSGKGTTAYREQNHVPLLIRHPAPELPRGAVCEAVTSHLDLTPTLLALAHPQGAREAKELPGKDFSGLLRAPQVAAPDAVREGALYCFNMWLFADADFIRKVADHIREHGLESAPEFIEAEGIQPDFQRKRSGIRSLTDGRYRFSRYFSNTQHNLPRSLEELFANNDVECFDLREDPHEMHNLALDPKAHGELLLALNARLTQLIGTEVGRDEGQMFPTDPDWAVTKFNA